MKTRKTAGRLVMLAAACMSVCISCTGTAEDSSSSSDTDAVVAVTGITISGLSSVTAGSSITLTVAVTPSNATNKTAVWSMQSGSDYASVSTAGVVTGKAEGTAIVKATVSGKYAVKTITVAAAETLVDGATAGTSVTGSASSYTASDTTWDTIVWSDEFEGTALKTADWCYDTGAGGWGNSELETYTTGNASVHGGVLDITAKSDLTSARIKSSGLKTFRYGRIEARIRTSQGTGSWPAFWMLGTSSDSWPYQGEIDIMEHANSDTFTYQTCHWNGSGTSTDTAYNHASYGGQTNSNNCTAIPSMDITEWHVYAIEWTSTLISFYVDDTKVMAIAIGSSAGTGLDTFNYPFYIIFNFAMGGQFPSIYDSTSFTGLPWHMYVDYVRVYQ